MAFLSFTDLINRTIVRLRQTAGTATQTYSQDEIGYIIREVYEMVRRERWWDHLMTWQNTELDGTTGVPTVGFDGASEGYEDIRYIYVFNGRTPMPQLTADVNPYGLTGNYPRYVEPRALADDSATPRKLFRVWPLTAVADSTRPLRVHFRRDPTDLFTDPAVLVPFDATCLINGAAARYLAQDGTSPGGVADLNSVFMGRLEQLKRDHDKTVMQLDNRFTTPGLTKWEEDRW